MKDILRISIASAFMGVSIGAGAVSTTPSVEDLPMLQQESQHSVAVKRISNLFTRAHYKEIALDDALSNKIFERYLQSLDNNKQIFLQSDVDGFEKYRDQFDNALSRGNLSIAYEMYNLSAERRVERFEYALSLLEQPFNFEQEGDKFYFDREDAAWPTTVNELNELWRQRVKYDALNLVMADKSWEEAKELLTKRYNRAIKRLKQAQSEDVFQTVMNSFARSIEAHTSYLSPRNADRFQMEMNLSFEGIGAVLQSEDDFTVIKSIVPGGPADKSKALKPEDKIVGVAQDDEEFIDVVGWRLDEVVELIKGPKGSTVRLQVQKGTTDSKSMSVVSLTRDKIKLEDRAAKSEVFVPDTGPNQGEKLGVITIPSFYNNLHADVQKEIDSLKAQNVKGIIVDLRGNGGGSLTEATLLTGLFIEQGPVVQIRYGEGKVSVNSDTDGVVSYDGPLTVLVDRYSASASEIFAAAMQDYNRALIIGEQTFGKGTVQQHRGLGRIYDLYDNPLGSVQFTIAKFYRIDGGSTQHRGVVPDIQYPSPIDPADWGESQEENALPWDSIERANYTTFAEGQTALDVLTAKHNARALQDPEFAYLYEDIQEYQKNKDKDYISLVQSERLAEKREAEQNQLKRTNERLARLDQKPVESLDDLPEVLEDLDPFLNEAANITFDMIDTGRYAITRN
ncbi:carboxy terminal-processing peptidase [Alteromonas aestuariivivens]|uniref:Carboxy terminal-processing peptidase n=1 Tax=Alteromonas aestuariivivens TaxID=1938339 RepID=A0A3D8M7W2_9ALTE|nr:carboxy terminal-processing peptidase [Alteromonas aestuariivivens]RDV25975.1 carboxy terminal-processing peptidase [Alteromonas aestuariivivens]